MMQSDYLRLRAVRLPAVQQCAVPRAVKQSAVPQGHRQGGDGAETGAALKVQLRRKKFRSFLGGEIISGCVAHTWPVVIIAIEANYCLLANCSQWAVTGRGAARSDSIPHIHHLRRLFT